MRYELDNASHVRNVRIIPATTQNQASIEGDLRSLGSPLASLPIAEATSLAEHAVRNYDPCLSCSVHRIAVPAEKSRA